MLASSRPNPWLMSYSALDQISPLAWTSPFGSLSAMVLSVSTRRRQWGSVDVYETESQSAMHASGVIAVSGLSAWDMVNAQ